MEAELLKTIAEASPWAALLLLTLWRFDVFNNRLISENRDREERLLADSREREAKYAQFINDLEASIEKVAENQRMLAEEVSRVREEIQDIKYDLKK
jgi:septal ring factor EnvC (AmiA/AmiB activator)